MVFKDDLLTIKVIVKIKAHFSKIKLRNVLKQVKSI